MSEQNIMRGDPNRIYRPSSGGGSGGGFVGGFADGLPGIANMIARRADANTRGKFSERLQAYKQAKETERAAMRIAALNALEDKKQANKMAIEQFKAIHKKATKPRTRKALEHERIQMETGRFAPGMRNKTLSDGKTANPYAAFSPEQEATHIANIAKETGWEPAETLDMPEVTEGGGIFGGGTKIPAGTFTRYQPGDNAEIETAAPVETQPAESE
jgi:hypothetical protein